VKILKLKMLRDEFWSILDINLNAYFPLKQEGKSCPFLTSLFLPPPLSGISVAHFASPGVPFDAHGVQVV